MKSWLRTKRARSKQRALRPDEPARVRRPGLFPGFGVSAMCHLLMLLLAVPLLRDCTESEPLEPLEGLTATAAPPQEQEMEIDISMDESPQPVAVSDPVKVPEALSKAPDQPKPEVPPPQPPPPQEKKPLKPINDNQLMIDQPKVEKESEPPPDTKVLGPQDRRVLQETQPMRRALETTPKKEPPPPDKKLVEKADDVPKEKEPPKEVASAQKPKGQEDKKKPEPKPSPDVKTPDADKRAEVNPSKAQKRLRKGAPGQGPTAKEAPPGEEVKPDEQGEEAKAEGSPREAQDDEAGDNAKKGESGDGAKFDIASAMRIDPGRYEEVFGERDARDKARIDSAKKRRFLGRWQERVKATRAALENFVPRVRYGNQIAINTRRSEYAAYIAAIHRKIHRRWGIGYLRHLDMNFGMGHPLSNSTLRTTLEFVIDGKTGEVRECNIVETSGVLEYDAEAIRIGLAVGPHEPAPDPIISGDGNVYLHWKFHRDTRQCGTFGVSVYVLDNSGKLDTYNVKRQLDGLNEHHGEGSQPHSGHEHHKRVDPSKISGGGKAKPAPQNPAPTGEGVKP